jgi:hypothetical protein
VALGRCAAVSESIEHGLEIPEESVAYTVFEVVGYFDSEGDLMYVSRWAGDAPLSTTLGLIEMAKHDVLADREDDDE